MNLRAFKKLQLRSRAKLIKHHGYHPDDFTPTDTADPESIYAPSNLKPKHTRRHSVGDAWIKRLIRGTPVMWITSGYYEPETDCYLPSEVLAEIEWANNTDWDAIWKSEHEYKNA
jgi:hypothetical protein